MMLAQYKIETPYQESYTAKEYRNPYFVYNYAQQDLPYNELSSIAHAGKKKHREQIVIKKKRIYIHI